MRRRYEDTRELVLCVLQAETPRKRVPYVFNAADMRREIGLTYGHVRYVLTLMARAGELKKTGATYTYVRR